MVGSLRRMEPSKADAKKRKPDIRDIWRLVLGIIGVIAIVQELRKPRDERTWEGKVANVVPYDFRMPSADRFRETYWNPDGPFLARRVFGVGWAPNFGALKRLVSSARSE